MPLTRPARVLIDLSPAIDRVLRQTSCATLLLSRLALLCISKADMDPNGDPDVLRVWSLLSEVSEQLSQNRSSAVNLHALADGAKVG